jgi:hypothetical protein
MVCGVPAAFPLFHSVCAPRTLHPIALHIVGTLPRPKWLRRSCGANCPGRSLTLPPAASPSPRQRGEGWGEGHKRDGRPGPGRLPGVGASSPQPSPPKEERETEPSPGGSVKLRPIALSACQRRPAAPRFKLSKSDHLHPGDSVLSSSCFSESDNCKYE